MNDYAGVHLRVLHELKIKNSTVPSIAASEFLSMCYLFRVNIYLVVFCYCWLLISMFSLLFEGLHFCFQIEDENVQLLLYARNNVTQKEWFECVSTW